jgi:hypothetical protein
VTTRLRASTKRHRNPSGCRDPELLRRVTVLFEKLWGGNQHTMAAALGVGQPLVSKILAGGCGISGHLLFLLATHPHVDPAWLFGRKQSYTVETVIE